jgi:hypothetical protein
MALRSHHSPRTRFAVISAGVHQGQPVTRVLYGEGGFTLLDRTMQDENPETTASRSSTSSAKPARSRRTRKQAWGWTLLGVGDLLAL